MEYINYNSSFEDVISKDIELLWAVQDYVHSNPKYKRWLHKIINKNPLQDICALVYIFFGIGWYEIGWPHFWVGIFNLFFAWILRKILEVKRPVEYDIRLQPMTDIHPDSFGFPSLESYMAIVVFGHYIIHYSSILLFLFFTPMIGLIGFTRVYSRSRFAHQIVGSWILGFIGLEIAHNYFESINIHEISKTIHGPYGAFALVLILANFALNMENNDSRLLGVSKTEFKTVLENIIRGSNEDEDNSMQEVGELPIDESTGDLITRSETPRSSSNNNYNNNNNNNSSSNGNVTPNRGFGLSRRVETPRAAAARRAAMEQSTKRLVGVTKRDSFYFLQRTLERRTRGGGVANGIGIGMDDGSNSRGMRSGQSTPRTPSGYL